MKRQLNDQVRLNSTTYYQPAFKDTSDYRLLEQASMLVKMAKGLDFKLSLDITFDSNPPDRTETGYGLQHRFGIYLLSPASVRKYSL